MRAFYWIGWLYIVALPVVFGQEKTPSAFPTDSVERNVSARSPSRAILWSFIPGGGQVYNNQAWKLPIVLGAGLTLVYYVLSQSRLYDVSRKALLSASPAEKAANETILGTLRLSSLESAAEVFRRNRDALILWTAFFYVIQGVEAYVSAHLKDFDKAFDTPLAQQKKKSPRMHIATPLFFAENKWIPVLQLTWKL